LLRELEEEYGDEIGAISDYSDGDLSEADEDVLNSYYGNNRPHMIIDDSDDLDDLDGSMSDDESGEIMRNGQRPS
jgi:hypothetical protein